MILRTREDEITCSIHPCHSAEWISKFNIPPESYNNIDFVQWNDYAMKTEKCRKTLLCFAVIASCIRHIFDPSVTCTLIGVNLMSCMMLGSRPPAKYIRWGVEGVRVSDFGPSENQA